MAGALPSLAKLPRAAPTDMEAEEAQTQGANASGIVAAFKFAEAGLAYARIVSADGVLPFAWTKERAPLKEKYDGERLAMEKAYADLCEVWRSSIRDPSQPTDAGAEKIEKMLSDSPSIVLRWARHYMNARGDEVAFAESVLRSLERPASEAEEGLYIFSALMNNVKDPDDELRGKKINKVFDWAAVRLSEHKRWMIIRDVLEDPEKVLQLPEAQVGEA